MNQITLRRLRNLELKVPPARGRRPHLAAASALVLSGGAFHVVADDELHMGVFSAEGVDPGDLVRLFPGELPEGKKARKKAKPDGEALALLPCFDACPHGALLFLGSGSRPTRYRGALLPLDRRGRVAGPASPINLAPLYDALGLDDLNIEGAYVDAGELLLMQRGHSRTRNARVRLPLAPLLGGFASGTAPAVRPTATEFFDLGAIENVPLGFTDAAALPGGRMLFTAVAEDKEGHFHDGPCSASAIGIAAPGGTVEFLGLLRPAWKVEGVTAWMEGRTIHVRMVTDADDASRPAVLLAGEIAATW